MASITRRAAYAATQYEAPLGCENATSGPPIGPHAVFGLR